MLRPVDVTEGSWGKEQIVPLEVGRPKFSKLQFLHQENEVNNT
jgi:hypothetical protein